MTFFLNFDSFENENKNRLGQKGYWRERNAAKLFAVYTGQFSTLSVTYMVYIYITVIVVSRHSGFTFFTTRKDVKSIQINTSNNFCVGTCDWCKEKKHTRTMAKQIALGAAV